MLKPNINDINRLLYNTTVEEKIDLETARKECRKALDNLIEASDSLNDLCDKITKKLLVVISKVDHLFTTTKSNQLGCVDTT